MLGMTKEQILAEANQLWQQNTPVPDAIAQIMEKNNQKIAEQVDRMITDAKGQPPFDLM